MKVKRLVLIGVFRLADRVPACCSEPRFFCQFAYRGMLCCFARFHLAAGERPQPRAMHIGRAPEQQRFSVAIENSDERNGLMLHAGNTKDFIGKVAAQGMIAGNGDSRKAQLGFSDVSPIGNHSPCSSILSRFAG